MFLSLCVRLVFFVFRNDIVVVLEKNMPNNDFFKVVINNCDDKVYNVLEILQYTIFY